METTEEEAIVKSMVGVLTDIGWDHHHAGQVEDWLLQYYCNKTEFEYINNIRIARGWITSEVKQYDKKQKAGSGGSIDMGLSTVEGKTIRIGFNHDNTVSA
jgi:hypothetical protein|tara:strand:- start:1805 stop:2107 length:303 start_codon:yes stop_codon:yes gene_type:complete